MVGDSGLEKGIHLLSCSVEAARPKLSRFQRLQIDAIEIRIVDRSLICVVQSPYDEQVLLHQPSDVVPSRRKVHGMLGPFDKILGELDSREHVRGPAAPHVALSTEGVYHLIVFASAEVAAERQRDVVLQPLPQLFAGRRVEVLLTLPLTVRE